MKRYIARAVFKDNKTMQTAETTRTNANKLAKEMKAIYGDEVNVKVHQVGIMTATLFGTEIA